MRGKIKIQKRSGEFTYFDSNKLEYSLERSGARKETINVVIENVTKQLYDGVSTRAIYKWAFSMLKKISKHTAAKYKLKHAIIELGPTGHPFERLVGELLKHQGYQVDIGLIVKGHCVSHEIDVVAEKEDRHFMIECKFHSDSSRKCDVKVPLYIQSRFLDVKKQWEKMPGHEAGKKFHQGWIVNNTRFSEDAIQFGACMGLNLIGWDYPKNGNLKERIDVSGLYPVTCLTSLTKHEKRKLVNKGYVLCKDLYDQPDLLDEIGVSEKKKTGILNEINAIY